MQLSGRLVVPRHVRREEGADEGAHVRSLAVTLDRLLRVLSLDTNPVLEAALAEDVRDERKVVGAHMRPQGDYVPSECRICVVKTVLMDLYVLYRAAQFRAKCWSGMMRR